MAIVGTCPCCVEGNHDRCVTRRLGDRKFYDCTCLLCANEKDLENEEASDTEARVVRGEVQDIINCLRSQSDHLSTLSELVTLLDSRRERAREMRRVRAANLALLGI